MEFNNLTDFMKLLKHAKVQKGRRGEYLLMDPVTIIKKPTEIKISDKAKLEFEYLINNNKTELLKFDWWQNDAELLDEYLKMYQDMHEVLLAERERPNSRNRAWGNAKCCYSFFVIVDNCLFVKCRSIDLLKGLNVDMQTFALLANLWNVENINVEILQPHIYLDNLLKIDDTVKRRK